MQRKPNLEEGATYFSVFYADEQLRYPLIDTLVYLGPDMAELDGATIPVHLFQHADSYHRDGSWRNMTERERSAFSEAPVVSFEPEHIDPIVDVNGLIETLAQWNASR